MNVRLSLDRVAGDLRGVGQVAAVQRRRRERVRPVHPERRRRRRQALGEQVRGDLVFLHVAEHSSDLWLSRRRERRHRANGAVTVSAGGEHRRGGCRSLLEVGRLLGAFGLISQSTQVCRSALRQASRIRQCTHEAGFRPGLGEISAADGIERADHRVEVVLHQAGTALRRRDLRRVNGAAGCRHCRDRQQNGKCQRLVSTGDASHEGLVGRIAANCA